MRQRPAVEVRYLTPRPVPGSVLEVELLLHSPSKTPVTEVLLTLSGGEHFYNRVPPLVAHHVALEARWRPGALKRGTHRYRAHFELPAKIPPSYRGRVCFVQYELNVHVDIPWWPDVDRRFLVPVYPVAEQELPRGPALFNSRHGDAEGTGSYTELSLDRTELEPGGVLTGVASLNRAPGVRELTLAFVQHERLLHNGSPYQLEAARFTARIASDPRDDGAPIPFRVQLPEGAPASFSGVACGCEWTIDLLAHSRFSGETLVRVPFRVRPEGSRVDPNAKRQGPPAVGAERRAQLWSATAARMGGSYDPAEDVLYASAGLVNVRLHTEQRASGPVTVASLRWPSLHLQLEVQPAGGLSRWFKRDLFKTHDGEFDRAFEARGREEAQVLAILTPAVRAALRTMPYARVDDEGARFESPGAGVDPAALERFVSFAVGVARRFSEAIEAVPAPALARGWVPAWRSFAARLRGRFEPGRVWIDGGEWAGRRTSLGLSWSNASEVDCTTVQVSLERPLDDAVITTLRDATGAQDKTLSDAARRALTSLRAKGSLVYADRTLHFVVAGPVEDPSTLEDVLEAISRLARALEGGADKGPFR